MIRVRGGTAFGNKSLCETCGNATIARGYALSQIEVHCLEFGRVRWPVHECSAFVVRGTLNLWQMSGMAKIIELKAGRVGFRSMTREERNTFASEVDT